MVVESIAIVLVIFVMSYMFVRSGKKAFGLSILPIIFVPLSHLFGQGLLNYGLLSFLDDRQTFMLVSIDILALVSACLLFGGMSKAIANKMRRRSYLFLCSGFSLALTFVYIYSCIA